MNPRMWNGRIFLKYTLLQLPELAVVVFLLMLIGQYIEIPIWIVWGILGLCVAKDVVLYPFVWRAYDWGRQSENNPMIGLIGTSKERLDPSGYVAVRGELWKAKVMTDGIVIEKDQNVRIKGIKGLTLLVEHETKDMFFE